MKLLINSYIKRDHDGYFISGQVLFESIVTNKESQDIPDSLVVNLSKSGNPECDTSLKVLQFHNGHAGTFHSHSIMREYIRRVTADVIHVIEHYNMELEELQSKDNKLTHAIVEDNEDLAPLPLSMIAVPQGTIMFDAAGLQEIHDALFGDLEEREEFEEVDAEEDED